MSYAKMRMYLLHKSNVAVGSLIFASLGWILWTSWAQLPSMYNGPYGWGLLCTYALEKSYGFWETQ